MQYATPSLVNPFLSPEYAIAAGAVRPESRIAVLSDGNTVVGYFPFEKRRFGVGVPLSGWLSACQGLIHAPGAEWDAGQLLRGCKLSAWKFDNLLRDQEPFSMYGASVVRQPVIDLADGFDAYHQLISTRAHRFARELGRKKRKLIREAGDLRVDSDARDLDALRMLMDWKSEQYQRTREVDRFREPEIRTLLELLLSTRTSSLTGQLSVLYAGDKPVAIQFGLRADSMLVGWFTGYNPQFGKYSPGSIHVMEMAQDLAKNGVRTIHMGAGARKYAETLKSYDLLAARGTVTKRSWLGAAHRYQAAWATEALNIVRRHPCLHDVADRILRHTGVARLTYGRL
ncbi:MAG: GNAT family N-acetyltransferase [Trebonia sp.]